MASTTLIPHKISYNSDENILIIILGNDSSSLDLSKIDFLTTPKINQVLIFDNPNITDKLKCVNELLKHFDYLDIDSLTISCEFKDTTLILDLPNIKSLKLGPFYSNDITPITHISKLPDSCKSMTIHTDNFSMDMSELIQLETLSINYSKYCSLKFASGILPPKLEALSLDEAYLDYSLAYKIPLSTKIININYTNQSRQIFDYIYNLNYLPDCIDTLCLNLQQSFRFYKLDELTFHSNIYLPSQLTALQLAFTDDYPTNEYSKFVLNMIKSIVAPISLIKLELIIYISNIADISKELNSLVTYQMLRQVKYLILQTTRFIGSTHQNDLSNTNVQVLPQLDNLEKLVLISLHRYHNLLYNITALPPNINELIIISVYTEYYENSKCDRNIVCQKLLQLLDVLPKTVKKVKLHVIHYNYTSINQIFNKLYRFIYYNGIMFEYNKRGIEFEYLFTKYPACLGPFSNFTTQSIVCSATCQVCAYKTWWRNLI